MTVKEINELCESGHPAEAFSMVEKRLTTGEYKTERTWLMLMRLGGDCLLDLKRNSEAVEWYSRVVEKSDDPYAFANRGCAKWLSGDPAGALEDYLKALPLYSAADDIEVPLRQAAQLSLEVGDPLDALKYLNECERRYGTSQKTGEIRLRINNYCES